MFTCPENIFEIEPSNIGLIFLFILFIESTLVISQGILGASWFIPKFFRKNYYEYYKTKGELEFEYPGYEKNICSICLDSLVAGYDSEILDDETHENSNLSGIDSNCINPKGRIQRILECGILIRYLSKHKTEFILTPCRHFFHSKCLNLWIENKKECPVCRKELPGIEYI